MSWIPGCFISPGTCRLERKQTNTTATGSEDAPTWNLLTEFCGSIQPAKASTVYDYSRRQIEIDTTIYTDEDLDSLVAAANGGQVKVTDRVNYGGVIYTVQGVSCYDFPLLIAAKIYELNCLRVRA